MSWIVHGLKAVTLALAIGAATPALAEDTTGAAPASLLLVLTGELVSATEVQIVVNADPTVVAFGERPDRLTYAVPVETFVDTIWPAGKDSLEGDPPNAAIVFGGARVEVAELTTVTREGRTVLFSIQDLEGKVPDVGSRIAFVIDRVEGDAAGDIADSLAANATGGMAKK